VTDLLRSTVAAMAADAAALVGQDNDAASRRLWQALRDTGFLELGDGGTGGDALHVLRELARWPVRTPFLEHVVLGSWVTARALAAAPPWESVTVALETPLLEVTSPGDGAIEVSGAIQCVRWAGWCDGLLLVVQRGGENLLLAVPFGDVSGQPALTIDRAPAMNLTLEAVRVPSERWGLISPHDRQALWLLGGLASACVLQAAMERAVELAVDHASQRRQFGRALIEFQSVRHQLVGALTDVYLSQAIVDRALSTAEPFLDLLDVGAARVQCGQAATRVGRTAHQIHGAIGLTEEHQLWHFTTRMWAARELSGTQRMWEEALGAAVRRPETFWDALTDAVADAERQAP
jgi:acyl-CoA dehydrogenase